MPDRQIYKPIQDKLRQKLLSFIPETKKPLYRAASYILADGGKRVRPLLLLLACQDMGGDPEPAYEGACALELIHTYSLIHDDLPCMDDDDYRRGKPSLHKAFGEAVAVLCGDYLMTRAFSVISDSKIINPLQKVDLISLLCHYAGGEQLIEGQMLDMDMSGKIGHFQQLQDMYLRKTAALFCCALEFGAIFSTKDLSVRQYLRQVGKKIGLAFQIKNDFLSIEKDRQRQKFTILTLYSKKRAALLIEQLLEEALSLLEKCETPFPSLSKFIGEMLEIHEV